MALPKEFEGGEEVKSNWFKFEKVGDGIKGTLLGHRFSKSKNAQFPDQEVYEIRKADGSLVNIGISTKKSGTVARLNSIAPGTIVGIVFESTTPAETKGFADAKNLVVLTYGTDPDFATAVSNDQPAF